MRYFGIRAAALMIFMMAGFVAACAGEDGADKTETKADAAARDVSPETAETRLSVPHAGKTLDCLVRTGLTPVHDAAGEEQAKMFSVSYLLDGGARERPVLFVFNGGPGASSYYLHVGVFGPKVFDTGGDGLEIPPPPYRLVDNPDTLLDVADMVFVDPVGTGYSRASKAEKDDDKAKGATEKDFWEVDKDIESVAEFIRVWLLENGRWGAPVYIAGESYGGLRAAGLASGLEDIGIAPSGVILVSPAISYQELAGNSENYAAVVTQIPSLTAVAHYHGRLHPELQGLSRDDAVAKAVEWARGSLLPGLWDGNRIPADEFDALVDAMSYYTGIEAAEIRARRLQLSNDVFNSLLLRDRGVFLSLYDGRMTAPGSRYAYGEDPAFVISGEPYRTAYMRYLNETLGLKVMRPYVYLSRETNRAWDFTQGARGLAGYPSTGPRLGEAMRRLPFLRVFLATGRYDVLTTAESALQTMARLDVPRERLERNFISHMYEGGHMFYTNANERRRLCDDLRDWMKSK